MVVRISDKTQNYSKVTKLLVKPNLLIEKLDDVRYEYLKLYVETIEIYMRENELFEMFIESLKYAKTGERK